MLHVHTTAFGYATLTQTTGAHAVVRLTSLSAVLAASFLVCHAHCTYSPTPHRQSASHLWPYGGHAQTSCNYFILKFQQAMISSHHEMFNYPGRFRDLMLFTVCNSRHYEYWYCAERVRNNLRTARQTPQYVTTGPLKVAKFTHCSSSVQLWESENVFHSSARGLSGLAVRMSD